MVDIATLKKEAEQSLTIASNEVQLGKKIKNTARLEIKRTKLRIKFIESQINVAKARENSADLYKNIAEEKLSLFKDKIIEIHEPSAKRDKSMALYNQKVAINQQECSDIEKQIAIIEKSISRKKIILANIIFETAKARETYGKNLYKYIDLLNAKQPQDKINQAKEKYVKQKSIIIRKREEHDRRTQAIMRKQNLIADLKKSLSLKLAERDKIRHVVDAKPPKPIQNNQ